MGGIGYEKKMFHVIFSLIVVGIIVELCKILLTLK